MNFPIRLCSDGFGIEKEYCDSKEEALKRFNELFESALVIVLADSGRSLAYRLCVDIGAYDDEGY